MLVADIRIYAMHTTTDELRPCLLEPSLFRSDLEGLLQETNFPTDMLLRAATFRRGLVMAGLTRFQSTDNFWRRPVNFNRVILVVGEAEKNTRANADDECSRRNLVLLKTVCQSNPDAYIVYKPHPEVWANMQARGHSAKHLLLWCDECVGDVPMSQLLPKVNEVHVMSSLAGFEALIRGKKVSCYGQSFYAGWGLTTDMVPMLLRDRQISLDELVAGALFSYPRYMSRLAGRTSHVESALNNMGATRHERAVLSVALT